ncbi:hypothetical protein [Protofrankia sp. BMG5.30]|uniref:hypothetical protein n=1 Tax=Protofrankia sp. BMG5.30 TaxID=1834514 RepID=UPI000A67200C|nr:hypothetical protein [Protofrankia sp. BMG5.30]
MFDHLRTWWSRVYTRVRDMPPDERDRGSTTEQVIWIAFLAGLALTVIGIFGPQILDAAQNIVFK